MKWLRSELSKVSRNEHGELVATVDIQIRWWHPSFWRELQSMITVEPSWLAWPMIAWFMVTRGWRINKGLSQ